MKRSPPVVEKERAVAAERLREQEAVASSERGGMELHELEVGERRAGRVGEQEALADRAARIRRALPQGRVAAGGEQRRARAGTSRSTVTTPEQRPPDSRSPSAPSPSATSIARLRGDGDRQCVRDAAPGLRAARVDDTAAGVAALAGEAGVELDSERGEVGDPRRRVLGEQAHRARAAEAAPGGERVRGVERRVVAGTDRGGDAALRRVAVRGAQGALREQEHRRVAPGGGERRVEAGDAAADDHEVVRPLAPAVFSSKAIT